MYNNGISYRQNTNDNILLLAAQRQLYSDAKFLMVLQFILCILLPIAIPIVGTISTVNSRYTALIAIISILLLLLNLFYFDKAIKSRKEKAAKLQELFDTNVFELPWNNMKCGIKEDSYKSLSYYSNKYKKKHKSLDSLKNWYPQEYSTVPIEIGRIMCQKVNIIWDKDIRENYKWVIIIIFSISALIIIVSSIIINDSFTSTLLNIIVPIIPLFVYYGKCYSENGNSINSMTLIKQKTDLLWEQLIKNKFSNDELTKYSRDLQDEIFQYRCNNYLIWDWFYKLRKHYQEEDMLLTARKTVEEFNSRRLMNV